MVGLEFVGIGTPASRTTGLFAQQLCVFALPSTAIDGLLSARCWI
jgi:hypothetical protein